ncbi:MAG: dihydrofolate reductase family protein [Campylobacterota bacterium]|nr:dihydrofolate reductase family protein [Campylobacterota bacterium]
MKCSIFIAPSVDGYIATEDGGVHWLETAGKSVSDIDEKSELMQHFNNSMPNYMQNIDCMIIGRKLMEVLSSFNLTPEQWPYGNTKIIALSSTIKEAPENLQEHVEIYSGSIPLLISKLENEGYKHAYVDGGTTITSFFNLELINEMTLTLAPVLLGSGIPLFGKLSKQIKLEDAKATTFPNNFVELKYSVKYL